MKRYSFKKVIYKGDTLSKICPRCGGTGTFLSGETCYFCKGTGTVD